MRLAVPLHRSPSHHIPISCLVAWLLILLLANGCAKPSLPVPSGAMVARETLVKTARSQIGIQYKNGGASPASGFDCSGFVYWAYGQCGVALPRTTKEQADCGTAISATHLQPGDLLVFKISFWRNLHTGIYVGKGKFIHSPSSGKNVREDFIHDPYWKKRLSTARRVM